MHSKKMEADAIFEEAYLNVKEVLKCKVFFIMFSSLVTEIIVKKVPLFWAHVAFTCWRYQNISNRLKRWTRLLLL